MELQRGAQSTERPSALVTAMNNLKNAKLWLKASREGGVLRRKRTRRQVATYVGRWRMEVHAVTSI